MIMNNMDDKEVKRCRRAAAVGLYVSIPLIIVIVATGLFHYLDVRDALDNGLWSEAIIEKWHAYIIKHAETEPACRIADIFTEKIRTDRHFIELDLKIMTGLFVALIGALSMVCNLSLKLRKLAKIQKESTSNQTKEAIASSATEPAQPHR